MAHKSTNLYRCFGYLAKAAPPYSTVQELIKGCQDHDTIQHSLNSFVAVACLVLWLPAVSGNITAPKPCAFKDSQDMWHAVAEKLNHPWHAS